MDDAYGIFQQSFTEVAAARAKRQVAGFAAKGGSTAKMLCLESVFLQS